MTLDAGGEESHSTVPNYRNLSFAWKLFAEYWNYKLTLTISQINEVSSFLSMSFGLKNSGLKLCSVLYIFSPTSSFC